MEERQRKGILDKYLMVYMLYILMIHLFFNYCFQPTIEEIHLLVILPGGKVRILLENIIYYPFL